MDIEKGIFQVEPLPEERQTERSTILQSLQKYLSLKAGAAERIKLIRAKDLLDNYKIQREALNDERLNGVSIAIVPDNLWVKGNQPSESDAENQLILIKQSYFEAQEKPDEIAWLIHELAHCQIFLDSEKPEDYQRNMRTFAFEDLKTEFSYPNNLVERHVFTKQFQFLRRQGKNREEILKMLSKYYSAEDFPFFNKLLDNIYDK